MIITYMWNLKYDPNELISTKRKWTHGEQIGVSQGGGGGDG